MSKTIKNKGNILTKSVGSSGYALVAIFFLLLAIPLTVYYIRQDDIGALPKEASTLPLVQPNKEINPQTYKKAAGISITFDKIYYLDSPTTKVKEARIEYDFNFLDETSKTAAEKNGFKYEIESNCSMYDKSFKGSWDSGTMENIGVAVGFQAKYLNNFQPFTYGKYKTSDTKGVLFKTGLVKVPNCQK